MAFPPRGAASPPPSAAAASPPPANGVAASGVPSPLNDASREDGWCFGPESVDAAIAALARGDMIVVTDDEDRENEGDLILAADAATPKAIAFMVRHTSGVLCCALPEPTANRLDLAPMVAENTDPKHTAFTVTVDVKAGTSTGISASDRAATLRALAAGDSIANDFNRPGHIFPLTARQGGVLKRAGHTEAAVDFARLAGRAPVGVLSEIVRDEDGEMARLPELRTFAAAHGLVLTSIADLIRWRRVREKLVVRSGETAARLPTRHGVFTAFGFRSLVDDVDHLALVAGDATTLGDAPVLVRVHSECCTGDVFGSLRCDCGPQLEYALDAVAAAGRGVVVYLRGQEGRGIGLGHKMRAYALQDAGRDTVQANEELGLPVDSREYGIGAQILADLGVSQLRLMTNNPAKYSGLRGYGLEIVERVPVQVKPNVENLGYLRTKREKMGHWLPDLERVSPLSVLDDKPAL
ncbi:hypothetical protein MMPV_002333 [Pyropia vietnamensis]